MSGQARIDSVDSLVVFRTSLVKFAEAVNTAMADAESDANRTLVWVETEQDTFWQGQIRKRHEDVERCKDAVRQKKLYKSSTGHTQSAIDEERALRVAQRRLEEAQEKLKLVRKWGPRLQKEISIYKGGVQRLVSAALGDIPVAISRLNKMIQALMQYAALSISGSGVIEDASDAMASMARAVESLTATTDYSPLRKKTAAIDRAKASPGHVRLETWSDGLVSQLERETLAKLDTTRDPPTSGQTLLIEQDAWKSVRLYLERIPPVESDSGWLIATEKPVEECTFLRVSVSELLEARPDLGELLVLPPGYLGILDFTGVAAVLTEKGDDVWSLSGPAPQ